MSDESGTPIFITKNTGLIEFYPYDIVTIQEYIKAKDELKEKG